MNLQLPIAFFKSVVLDMHYYLAYWYVKFFLIKIVIFLDIGL